MGISKKYQGHNFIYSHRAVKVLDKKSQRSPRVATEENAAA